MNYTKEYFIQKFEAIPDDKWITGEYENKETGACCAAGHCGFQKDMLNPEITALVKLFNIAEGKNTGTSAIFNVNDGGKLESFNGVKLRKNSPKQNIINVLKSL